MFIDMQRYPDKPIYIARWPKYIEDTTDPNDWIMGKVEAIIHVLPEHGKTMRFYKFSVEKAHTFLVGNDHWIAHNWAGPTFQAVAEWGMDFAMHGIRSTAEQGAMPGWCPSRIHGRAGDAYWQIEIEEKFKAAQRQYNREEAQRMAGNTAAFAGGNPPPQATPPTPPPPQNPKNGTDPEKNKYEGMKDSSVQKGTRSYDNRVDEHIKKLGQEIRDKPWISYASSLGITSEKVIDNIKNGRIGHLVDEIVAFCQNRQELIDEATRRGINPR
jgi:hypothetical protein